MMQLYYFQTNIFCVLILIIVYLVLRNRSGTIPARKMVFGRLLLTIAVVCATDIFAWYFLGKEIQGARTILHISNAIYYAAITLAGYIWLCYVELRVKGPDFNFGKHRKITAIPLVIMLLIIATNHFTGILYSIDEHSVYSRADGVIIHWIISWFYLIYAAIEVILKIRKSSSKAEKNQFIPMIWFLVPPVIAAILQMFIFGITSTQSGMTLGVLIVTLNFMTDEVSKDTLTGLNNRKALETTMIEYLQRAATNVTVLMCDIDKFKSINDNFGHTAGDMALKRMAAALKKTCGETKKNLFLCRYGGDEFVFCAMDMEKEEVDELVKSIERNIESINSDYSADAHFGISVGTAAGICEKYEDIESLISIADKFMYEKKQAKKLNA